mmetsp:Transcript_23660/g.55117  ORF Transcript_23660/g.55117 Transcript_23660/m.55117 type:complete len:698 (-) Transcript_23660:452-2545(-)
MPYARVGAMPQPSQENNQQTQNRNNRGGRKQGITMEDLKKQTALRLAQEQQQRRLFSGFQQKKERSVPVHEQPYNSTGSYGHRNDQVPATDFGGHSATRLREVGQSVAPPNLEGTDVRQFRPEHGLSAGLPAGTGSAPSGQARGGNVSATFPAETQAQPPRYPRSSSVSSMSSASIKSNSSQLDSSTQHGQASVKSKLPHGLTVQELKEMTKARLQAEAAERHEHEKQTMTVRFPQQPVTQSYQRNREHASAAQEPMNRESPQTFVHHQHQLETSSNDMPRVVINKPPPGLGEPGRGFSNQGVAEYPAPPKTGHNAPLPTGPPGFQSFPSSGSLSAGGRSQDPTHWQQPKVDTWETASVASMNSTVGSEYLGSEPAHPQQAEEPNDISFARSRSYQGVSGYNAGGIEKQPFESSSANTTPVSAGASFYDHSGGIIPNRRRASTLSPRPALTHLLEDRPLLAGTQDLRIPSFEASARNPLPMRPQSQSEYGLPEVSNRQRTYSGGFMDGYAGAFNRPRTSSAPSVSSFFPGESDAHDLHGLTSGLRPSNEDDLPNSVVESVLGGTSLTYRGESDEFGSVLRSAAANREGLSGGEHLQQPRGVPQRADSSPTLGFDAPWSSVARQPARAHQDNVDTLANGLGSVLKLSGIDSNDNLVSRMDPEVSFFPWGGSAANNDDSARHYNDIYGPPSAGDSSRIM